MITKPTVFVLGAGSMTDYGFPIGWELVREVVEGFAKNAELRTLLLSNSDFHEQQLDRYLEALDGSAQNSVDAFLEEQQGHLEIGIALKHPLMVSGFVQPEMPAMTFPLAASGPAVNV